MKINVCFKWLHFDPHIRNVESPVAQAFTLLTKWRYSECNDNGKVLKVLSTFTDMRIHSGEKVLLNDISIGKSSIFSTCLRKIENSHCKGTCEYKEWGIAFNDVSYIRKYTKSLSGCKISTCISTGKIVSDSCFHWHMRTHTGGDPRNAIHVVQSQPRFCRVVTKYTENKMYKYC